MLTESGLLVLSPILAEAASASLQWGDPQFWGATAIFLVAILQLTRPLWRKSKQQGASGCTGCASSKVGR